MWFANGLKCGPQDGIERTHLGCQDLCSLSLSLLVCKMIDVVQTLSCRPLDKSLNLCALDSSSVNGAVTLLYSIVMKAKRANACKRLKML